MDCTRARCENALVKSDPDGQQWEGRHEDESRILPQALGTLPNRLQCLRQGKIQTSEAETYWIYAHHWSSSWQNILEEVATNKPEPNRSYSCAVTRGLVERKDNAGGGEAGISERGDTGCRVVKGQVLTEPGSKGGEEKLGPEPCMGVGKGQWGNRQRQEWPSGEVGLERDDKSCCLETGKTGQHHHHQ